MHLFRKLLIPLGLLYGSGTGLRNAMYDRGLLHSRSLGARTISVGNLTTGGTGKTPLVALTAELLADHGEKVCVLTRGYGRRKSGVRVLVSDGSSVLADAVTGGDEPVELAGKLIGKATVIAEADRISAARWATRKFGVTAFVLDDGFQHRRAKRDVDIVCIDAMNPFDSGHVLPGGQLRESIGGLRRADAIVITRSDLVADIAEVRQRIKEHAPDAKIFLSSTRITRLRAVEHSGTQDPTKTAGTKVFAFCALGNPRNFFELLARENFEIAGTKVFRDHHRYSQDDIEAISQAATNAGAEMLLTTAKDAVKLDGAGFKIPCRVVEISVDVNDLEDFRKLVTGSD